MTRIADAAAQAKGGRQEQGPGYPKLKSCIRTKIERTPPTACQSWELLQARGETAAVTVTVSELAPLAVEQLLGDRVQELEDVGRAAARERRKARLPHPNLGGVAVQLFDAEVDADAAVGDGVPVSHPSQPVEHGLHQHLRACPRHTASPSLARHSIAVTSQHRAGHVTARVSHVTARFGHVTARFGHVSY